MNMRFVIPVTVATALHALVFLSPDRSRDLPMTKPAPDQTIIREFVLVPKEEPDEPIVAAPEEPRPKGVREALRPMADEPPPSPKLGEFSFTPIQPPPSASVARIVPGRYGDPEGIADSWTARPVLSSAMLDNIPRRRAQVAPVYPDEARRSGLTGEVVVEFVVDEGGRVLNPRVVRSSHALFERTTLAAVAKWRFEPGRKDGRVVRFRMMAPVMFDLDAPERG